MGTEEVSSRKTLELSINLALGLILLLLVPLLFTTIFSAHDHRLIPYFGNSAHVLLFFALIWLTMNLSKLPDRLGFLDLIVAINLAVLLLSLGIEGIQSLQAREGSWEDVFRNCLGSSLAIMFHPKTPAMPVLLKAFLQIIFVLLLLNTLYPLTKNCIDWFYARTSFPVLADFEAPFENERWIGGELVTLNSEPNNFVLRYQFDSAKYSTVSIVHIPGNWDGYHCFDFRIFNPGPTAIDLIIRINDRRHDASMQFYSDRFNQRLIVLPGWNKYSINLEKIKTAPLNRLMDMANVSRNLFFSSYLKIWSHAILRWPEIESRNTTMQFYE